MPAVLFQVSGDREPSAREPVSEARLLGFGRAALSAIYALDEGPNIPTSSPPQLQVGGKLLPAWAIRLLAFALLLAPLLVSVDALARLRRRREPVLPWLAWVLSWSAPLPCRRRLRVRARSLRDPGRARRPAVRGVAARRQFARRRHARVRSRAPARPDGLAGLDAALLLTHPALGRRGGSGDHAGIAGRRPARLVVQPLRLSAAGTGHPLVAAGRGSAPPPSPPTPHRGLAHRSFGYLARAPAGGLLHPRAWLGRGRARRERGARARGRTRRAGGRAPVERRLRLSVRRRPVRLSSALLRRARFCGVDRSAHSRPERPTLVPGRSAAPSRRCDASRRCPPHPAQPRSPQPRISLWGARPRCRVPA